LSGGKREKKVTKPTTKSSAKKTIETTEQISDEKKKVGWEYRYRVSKMREAQKREASPSKKQDKIVVPKENLDPDLARLTPEERIVGWQYR
jgi:hypothetical protein